MAKIYRVIQTKLNQFKKLSTSSLTYQQSAFKRYHSAKHFSEFLPTRWRQKSTGIDMEPNYVTVTLCIINRAAVGTEFLSSYPPHTHTHGDPHGSPYPRQSSGLPWGRNFYPHTHPILIPMGIAMDPHTHGRVQGSRGDGISILIHTPYSNPWGSPWIPIPTAEFRAPVGMEFLSPYTPHTNGDPHGDPHTHDIPDN